MTDQNDAPMDPLESTVGWIDDGDSVSSRDELSQDVSGRDVLGRDADASDESVAEQLLVNSLLQGQFEDSADRETRIRGVLDRFDQLDVDKEPVSAQSLPRKPSRFASRLTQVVASLAAVLVVAVGIWFASTPQTAEAAFQRVVQSIEARVIRVYKVTVKGEWLGRTREWNGTLHSLGPDKFVVETHDALIKPKLAGSDGTERWTVSGRRTWNSSEATNGLRDFLIDRITLRNLHINELITEIPENYQLNLLAVEPLPGDESVECRPIEGVRIGDDTAFPELVRIWPHPKTGVVARMEIVRERRSGKAPNVIELLLVGEEPAAEEIFRPEHYLKE